MTGEIRAGSSNPLGATPRPGETNFAVAAAADGVLLCLFGADGSETQMALPERDGDIFHGSVSAVGAGQRYGYRAVGAFEPAQGSHTNPAKLLLDPYARAVLGDVQFSAALVDHAAGDPGTADPVDSAPYVPRSVVVDQAPDPAGRPAKPRHHLADTIFYEVHVKGFTQQSPDVPAELRGTYAGLASEASLSYLTGLGITTVELLPIHQSVPEQFLVDRGLTNYWGYNTIGFFAPHAGYSAAVRAGRPEGLLDEFRSMVDALHAAGLEVILDVVFNHTAEGGPDGPTLCHRGLDNAAYYRLAPGNLDAYFDTTGTGNTFNAGNPLSLRLIMDSLRYWLTDMGVDGFRFDLAPALARQDGGFSQYSAFLDLVAQDPVVSEAKLIAEPWDVGQFDSYDLGRFPAQWSEWNGRFRDTVRDFWRSKDGTLGDFATRISGSADIFGRVPGRRPSATINLITVHDGFTLTDLVSYDSKHNEANGENNADGTTDNRSWNCGVEGPTADADVSALRGRQRRAFLTTLLLSGGTPLLLGGDEWGRTQQGNNNAYCQDNALTWFDWSAIDESLLAFTASVIALRQKHPVFRRRRYSTGATSTQLSWYAPDGTPMTPADWNDPEARAVTLVLDGADDPDRDDDGNLLIDDDFILLINGWWEPLSLTLPASEKNPGWIPVIETGDPLGSKEIAGEATVTVGPRSIVVLQGGRP